jgi:hypothetical protein
VRQHSFAHGAIGRCGDCRACLSQRFWACLRGPHPLRSSGANITPL